VVDLAVPLLELAEHVVDIRELPHVEEVLLHEPDEVLHRALLPTRRRRAQRRQRVHVRGKVPQPRVQDDVLAEPRDDHGLRPVEHPLLRRAAERDEARQQRPDQRLSPLVGGDNHAGVPGELEPTREEGDLQSPPVAELHPRLPEVELGELPAGTVEQDDGLPLRWRADGRDQLVQRTALAGIAPTPREPEHLCARKIRCLLEEFDHAGAESVDQRRASSAPVSHVRSNLLRSWRGLAQDALDRADVDAELVGDGLLLQAAIVDEVVDFEASHDG